MKIALKFTMQYDILEIQAQFWHVNIIHYILVFTEVQKGRSALQIYINFLINFFRRI